MAKHHHCLLRTALAVMLRGNHLEGWLAHFGLKCSSWTAVNSGTSSRSACSAIGNTDYKSVRDANSLGSRNFVGFDSYFVLMDVLLYLLVP